MKASIWVYFIVSALASTASRICVSEDLVPEPLLTAGDSVEAQALKKRVLNGSFIINGGAPIFTLEDSTGKAVDFKAKSASVTEDPTPGRSKLVIKQTKQVTVNLPDGFPGSSLNDFEIAGINGSQVSIKSSAFVSGTGALPAYPTRHRVRFSCHCQSPSQAGCFYLLWKDDNVTIHNVRLQFLMPSAANPNVTSPLAQFNAPVCEDRTPSSNPPYSNTENDICAECGVHPINSCDQNSQSNRLPKCPSAG